jgi:hypothetical protein
MSFVSYSFGQELSPEERAKIQTERMTKALLLSADQQEKVHAINLGVAQKNDVIRTNENFSEDQKKEYMKGNLDGKKASLKLILNEEQFKKYERMETERKYTISKSREIKTKL